MSPLPPLSRGGDHSRVTQVSLTVEMGFSGPDGGPEGRYRRALKRTASYSCANWPCLIICWFECGWLFVSWCWTRDELPPCWWCCHCYKAANRLQQRWKSALQVYQWLWIDGQWNEGNNCTILQLKGLSSDSKCSCFPWDSFKILRVVDE